MLHRRSRGRIDSKCTGRVMDPENYRVPDGPQPSPPRPRDVLRDRLAVWPRSGPPWREAAVWRRRTDVARPAPGTASRAFPGAPLPEAALVAGLPASKERRRRRRQEREELGEG